MSQVKYNFFGNNSNNNNICWQYTAKSRNPCICSLVEGASDLSPLVFTRVSGRRHSTFGEGGPLVFLLFFPAGIHSLAGGVGFLFSLWSLHATSVEVVGAVSMKMRCADDTGWVMHRGVRRIRGCGTRFCFWARCYTGQVCLYSSCFIRLYFL